MVQLTKTQKANFSSLKVSKNSTSYKSLVAILNNTNGIERTGTSGYSGGYASKSVWTSELSQLLTVVGIAHTIGNDAPRGGASGEFVQITDKRLLGRISKVKLAEKIEAEKVANKVLAQKEAEKVANKVLAQKEARISELKSEIAKMLKSDEFNAKWNSIELKELSGMGWNGYRDSLKKEHPTQWAELKAIFQAKNNLK